MTFTQEIKQAAQAYWNSSFTHPFVQGIGEGTLPLSKFRHYVMQDAYYLKHFAKIQAKAASKADDFATIATLAEHATSTYEAELSLHQSFFKPLGITAADLEAFEPAPTAYAYVSHMHHASEGTLGETIAAILPCYWLYYEVGQQLLTCTPEEKSISNGSTRIARNGSKRSSLNRLHGLMRWRSKRAQRNASE